VKRVGLRVLAAVVALLVASVPATAAARLAPGTSWELAAYVIVGGACFAAVYGWLVAQAGRRRRRDGGERG
jgi:hypothetical protein